MKWLPSIVAFAILLSGDKSLCCTCVSLNRQDSLEASVKSGLSLAHIVVIAEIIKREEINVWEDTSSARFLFRYAQKDKSLPVSYEVFKTHNYQKKQLELTALVTSSYKGITKKESIKIWTGSGKYDCGFPFVVGSRYLIYALTEYSTRSNKFNKKAAGRTKAALKGIYSTNICMRTKLLEEATKDLRVLDSLR